MCLRHDWLKFDKNKRTLALLWHDMCQCSLLDEVFFLKKIIGISRFPQIFLFRVRIGNDYEFVLRPKLLSLKSKASSSSLLLVTNFCLHPQAAASDAADLSHSPHCSEVNPPTESWSSDDRRSKISLLVAASWPWINKILKSHWHIILVIKLDIYLMMLYQLFWKLSSNVLLLWPCKQKINNMGLKIFQRLIDGALLYHFHNNK